MSNHIRIGLLGFGRIGKIHFRNLQHYFSNVQIVAVADPVYSSTEFAKHFGNHILFSPHEEEVIQHADVDAVLICSPTSAHAYSLEMALACNKHVFCEKPLHLSLETTEALTKQVNQARVKVMLGFNRRFDPDFLQAKIAISQGAVGNVQIVKITSRDPGLPPLEYLRHSGGLFMDMAIHDFDMARYIMNKPVVEVFAKGLVAVDPAVAEAGDIDTALTTLTFEDGTYAVIDNSRKAVYGYDQRLEVFGSGGMLQVENNLHNRNVIYNEKGIHKALPLDFFMDRYAASYLGEMQQFIEAIQQNTEVPVSAKDALEATKIAVAAKMSMEQGRPVKLNEFNASAALPKRHLTEAIV